MLVPEGWANQMVMPVPRNQQMCRSCEAAVKAARLAFSVETRFLEVQVLRDRMLYRRHQKEAERVLEEQNGQVGRALVWLRGHGGYETPPPSDDEDDIGEELEEGRGGDQARLEREPALDAHERSWDYPPTWKACRTNHQAFALVRRGECP